MQSILQSEKAWEIIRSVAPVYGDAYVALWLFQTMGERLDNLYQIVSEYRNQTKPQTATWALPMWESQYGIVSDENIPIEQRRLAVINKMYSSSPINEKRLSLEIQAVCGTESRIEGRTGKRKFTIYISSRPHLVDETMVKKRVDELKPAELIYDIKYENTVTTGVFVGGAIQKFKEITLTEV